MISPAFDVSTDPARLDIDSIHKFLSESSYWAQGRSRAAVEENIRHSLCFGVFDGVRQVGFARVVTDRVVFGYLADVFTVPEYRGRGVGKALIAAVVDHPVVKSLQVVLLRTRDAHSLYANFGFKPVPSPEEMMGRYQL